jgi:hypothetical protein
MASPTSSERMAQEIIAAVHDLDVLDKLLSVNPAPPGSNARVHAAL